MKREFTTKECVDIMLLMRSYDVPDDAIGAVFDLSRQRVHVICGPRTRKPLPAREVPKDLPQLLETWRAFRGLSKSEAARTLKIAPSTYAGIENGRRNASAPHILANFLRNDMLDKHNAKS